jgi:RNA polymerase sigma factor for flagellar operon FliA
MKEKDERPPATAYGAHSDAEREALLLEQMPQVRSIARRIHERLPRHVPLEDLVHAGVLGLIDALNKFDAAKHVRFVAYAKFRIRGAILDSLRELDWSPRHLRRRARQLEETHRQLATRLGREPSETEIATELHIDLRQLQELLHELRGLELGSMWVERAGDGREENLGEMVAANPDETPYQRCLAGEMKQALAAGIHELPEKERRVLALYYFEELTMKEVGTVLGVGESRVSQLHSLALVRLRARLGPAAEAGPAAYFKAAGGGE